MSSNLPHTPRHGTHRASHLRQVSNSGSDTPRSSRPTTATSDAGTAQHDLLSAILAFEKKCVLWVHDESFSKDEVVLNLSLFPEVKDGDALAIVGLKMETGVRDFQDRSKGSMHESDTLPVGGQRERSSSTPRSPVSASLNDFKYDFDSGKRYLFIAQDMPKDLKAKHATLEISVAKHIADVFGFKHRSNCLLSTADVNNCSASHVEMAFKDEYLARSDMWQLSVREMCNKTVYKGQKVVFMGTIKVHVTAVYVGGRKVQSAFFSTITKPIFRSESARYILFVQMSREMWDFDSEGSGEIMFNKVVNGFLPALFKKWASLKAKHLVSIVLFTRVEYDMGIASELASSGHDSTYHTGIQSNGSKKPYKDFYRVVVSEMASGSWTTILYQLKREFKFFRRDISLHRIQAVNETNPQSPEDPGSGVIGTQIEAEPSLAMYGNVLEAINLASSQFAHDYIDRDLMRTGISIVVITPCAGLFEVDYETLRMTTENLIGNGIGIDLVCLPKLPLHSVPLFRYRNPDYGMFQESLHIKALQSEDSTPRQNPTVLGTSFSSMAESFSPSKASHPERNFRMGSMASVVPPSEWLYAIPHWVDVSFWTGASQDIGSGKPSVKSAKRYLRHWENQKSNEFAIRCKMYEMEMASVMENAMTEISITPLQHESFFPMMMTGSREVPFQQKNLEKTGLIKRAKTYAGLQEFIGGPSKPLADRHSSEDFRRFLKVLESFDLAKSQVDEHPRIRRNTDGSKYFKPGSEEASRRLLAEDPKLFGTSFTDDSGIPKGAALMATSVSGRNRQDSQPIEEPPRPRKASIGTMTVNSKGSPIRPSKFSRQISLGKHGFNLAAPKAAMATIQTENASATVPASTNTRGIEQKRMNVTASHLFGNSTNSPARPSSSQSELSKKSDKSDSKTRMEENEKTPSKPMTIKSALQSLDSTNQFKSRSVLGSFYETAERRTDTENNHLLHSVRPDDNQKLYNTKLLAGAVPELPATLSPTTALSPWLTVLNPSNPAATDIQSQYRRWQHVFPRQIHAKTMKWKSLCCPAAVPLTTNDFPTKYQLETEYQQKPYNISRNSEEDLVEDPESREEFFRELIALRLSHGFQVVVGPTVGEAFGQKSLKIANVFDRDLIAEDGASVFMSLGNIIHQLSCVNETEVEVNMFVRKPTASVNTTTALVPAIYNPAVRTTLAMGYDSRKIVLGKPRDEYNWSYVDAYIAGCDEEMSENLRFWRARYVLIPVERPTQAYRAQGEDNEEEIRLEGIKKLTQIWQRHRVVPASERRTQRLASRKPKDQNPLDIVYKTEDPSVVVTAELETLPLLETSEAGSRRGQLIENERFRKNKFDPAALAAAIQAPVEKGGVRVQDRRWHWRLHYNCFIGLDMTTWILDNFEDIHTREEAVEFGNKLMVKEELHRIVEYERDAARDKSKEIGMFVHVERRHAFRDGQYFYQVAGEHANTRPGSRSGWFSQRRRDTSVPSTPLTAGNLRDSPRPTRSRSSSHHDERSSSSGATTPTTAAFSAVNNNPGSKIPRVALSKVMKYDVDHRKRSYRPEHINLHYDRLHNPDNCYHIRIDWMNVTAKLIEDAIASWATTAERYGLRLVEAPIGEACSITSVHPFRSPYMIELVLKPPEEQPKTYFDSSSFGAREQSSAAGRHYYHKHIMKKFNFVLDIEAAQNFPSNVDVTYSWGKPDFKYSQYIHRSGIVLAQITDEGDFLLLANRLYNNRTAAAREAERNFKTEPSQLENIRANNRISSAFYGVNFPLSDRNTPTPSPALRPVQTSSTNSSSPILKPATFVTSDVLGASLQNSRIALSLTPEAIKNDLEKFCSDAAALEIFYKDVFEKAAPPTAPTPPIFLQSPYRNAGLGGIGSDREIPMLGLPPNLLAREGSASPAKFGGGMMPFLGRRQSVQVGFGRNELSSGSGNGSNDGGRLDEGSPRGSISEAEW